VLRQKETLLLRLASEGEGRVETRARFVFLMKSVLLYRMLRDAGRNKRADMAGEGLFSPPSSLPSAHNPTSISPRRWLELWGWKRISSINHLYPGLFALLSARDQNEEWPEKKKVGRDEKPRG
jgi:hypothetical protein